MQNFINPFLRIACVTICSTLFVACEPLEFEEEENTTADNGEQVAETAQHPSPVSLQKELAWDDCHHHSDWFDEIPESMQCATLTVPLDNSYPKGKTIDLALTKMPAQTAYPIGSLLVIAGGPGDTSIDAVMTSFGDNQAVANIKDNFDIIGFAPRGIAPSEPALDCGDASNDDEQSSETFVAACVQHSGNEFLKHIDTKNAVLDIERIRIALGEKRLSFIGYSYGTKVLARYVEAFPMSVRAAVLDGVVDVTEDYFTALAGQEKGFQATFERFAKYCTEFEACPFDDIAHYEVGFWSFLNTIDKQKMTDQNGNIITADDVLAIIQDNMMWQSDWDTIIALMEDLQNKKTDVYNELNGQSDDKAEQDLGLVAINCADANLVDKSNYLQQSKAVDALSSYDNYRNRDDDYYLDACYYWQQGDGDSTDEPIINANLPQILFVAQQHDPTTPYRNAVHMAKLFNAPLLTRHGDGHTLALTDESVCVDDTVAKYLKSPTTPIYSQTCD